MMQFSGICKSYAVKKSNAIVISDYFDCVSNNNNNINNSNNKSMLKTNESQSELRIDVFKD